LSLEKKLVKNTIANYLIRFWTWGVTFFLFPFIVHHLGASASSVWLLVSSLTGYFSLLDLGIGDSLVKYVAQYKAQKDEHKLNQLITTTFFIYLAMGLLAATGLFTLGHFFITSFNIPVGLVQKARIITYVAAATMLLGFPTSIFSGVLSGLQRYDISALIGFASSILSVILSVLFLLKGYGVVTLVLINSISGALGWALNAYYAKKLLPFLRISCSLFNKETIRVLFGLAVSLFVIHVCMMIIYPTDRIVIGAFLPVGLIVFYEAAYKIYHLVVSLPQLLASAVIPAASELDILHDAESLKNLFLRGTKYMTSFFLALAIPIILLSKQILVYWMGNDFGSHYLLVVVFIAHLFFNFNHLFAYYLLVGMNKIRFTLWYYVSSASLNLALSVVLVQKIGLIGVVLGTVISYAILEPVFVWYNFKTFNVKLGIYCREVLCQVYPQAGATALLLYLLKTYYLPRSLVEVGIFAILSATFYLVLFYFFGTKDWERRSLVSTITSVLEEIRFRLTKGKT